MQRTFTSCTRRGGVVMLSAGALIAATSLLAKALALSQPGVPGLHPFQISAGRFFFALLAISFYLKIFWDRRPPLQGANWRWHLTRSLCGWLGVTAMFAAVSKMPVAEATALSFLSPIVTMGLAIAMLGEHLTLRKVVAAFLAFIGAVLILRPGEEAFQLPGFLALAAAGCMGLEAIYIKRLSDSEPAIRVLLINNSIGALVSIMTALSFWLWPTSGQWALLVAIGFVMVCAQAMFIQAMRSAEASMVIPAFYSVLLFAAIYDFVLYGVVISPVALLGAALISVGAMVLALRAQ